MAMTSSKAGRLHSWAMWRMKVNQELIHGLEVAVSGGTGDQSYHSFKDNYSITQRYIQNPHVQRDETMYIRHSYGIPPSPMNPMGDNLFFLYGLPRVSANPNVPNVTSSCYSIPSLISKDNHENMRIQQVSPLLDEVDHKPSTGQPGDRRPANKPHNINELGPWNMSPVNFRDKPEVDYHQVQSTSGSKINNINKPVLVPPAEFRKGVLKRSNKDLELVDTGDTGDIETLMAEDEIFGEGFDDPSTVFNDRNQTYSWEEMHFDEGFSAHPYVDESHMKTHI